MKHKNPTHGVPLESIMPRPKFSPLHKMEDLFTLDAPGVNFDMLKKMSDEGDLDATVMLARCYPMKTLRTGEDGVGIAMELLQEAITKGSSEAILVLADFHYTLLEWDNVKEYYVKLHERHIKDHEQTPSLQTEYDLASDLLGGYGVEQDVAKAKEQMRSLADRGFAKAYLDIAKMYEGFYGCRRNRKSAIKAYKKGVELGDPECIKELSKVYECSDYDGYPLSQEQELELFELYKKLCQYKYGWAGKAQFKMGEYYLNGKFVEADWAMAKSYFAAAATFEDIGTVVYLNAMQIVEKEFSEKYGSITSCPKDELYESLKKAQRVCREDYFQSLK